MWVGHPALTLHNLVPNCALDSRHMSVFIPVPENGGRGAAVPTRSPPGGGLAAGERAGYQVQIHSANRWVTTQSYTSCGYY